MSNLREEKCTKNFKESKIKLKIFKETKTYIII